MQTKPWCQRIARRIRVTPLLLVAFCLPARATLEKKAACFAPVPRSSRSEHRHTGTELRSVPNHHSVNSRRSALLKVFGAPALIVAKSYSAEAEVKSSASRDRLKVPMNFPRVHPGLKVGESASGVLCEIFVDFTCPYSRKLFTTVSRITDAYSDKMQFVYHNIIQPWHHQSLWLHESSFAVRVLYPNAELAYWKSLFADAPNWYDKEVYGLTRGSFYDKIASFAAGVVVSEGSKRGDVLDAGSVKARILQYLIPPKQEGGNFPEEARNLLGSGPEDDENAVFPLTRQIVKFQRKRGIHVSPTVFFNGIEQPQVSSGWTADDWTQFLDRALS